VLGDLPGDGGPVDSFELLDCGVGELDAGKSGETTGA